MTAIRSHMVEVSFVFVHRWSFFDIQRAFMRWPFVFISRGHPVVFVWRWPFVFVQRTSSLSRGGPSSSFGGGGPRLLSDGDSSSSSRGVPLSLFGGSPSWSSDGGSPSPSPRGSGSSFLLDRDRSFSSSGEGLSGPLSEHWSSFGGGI